MNIFGCINISFYYFCRFSVKFDSIFRSRFFNLLFLHLLIRDRLSIYLRNHKVSADSSICIGSLALIWETKTAAVVASLPLQLIFYFIITNIICSYHGWLSHAFRSRGLILAENHKRCKTVLFCWTQLMINHQNS